jgi:hypothetical protein
MPIASESSHIRASRIRDVTFEPARQLAVMSIFVLEVINFVRGNVRRPKILDLIIV